MNQCKNCGSADITYVTNYEHLDFESECSVFDDGYECSECGCFHMEDGSFEYYANYSEPNKVNYSQLWETY